MVGLMSDMGFLWDFALIPFVKTNTAQHEDINKLEEKYFSNITNNSFRNSFKVLQYSIPVTPIGYWTN